MRARHRRNLGWTVAFSLVLIASTVPNVAVAHASVSIQDLNKQDDASSDNDAGEPPCVSTPVLKSEQVTVSMPAIGGGNEQFTYHEITDQQLETTYTYNVPMDGWNPATGSDAELALVGNSVPPRPTSSEYDSESDYESALDQWNLHWSRSLHYENAICAQNNPNLHASTSSPNYSGFGANKTNSSFTKVYADETLTLPTYYDGGSTGDYRSTHAAWVGLQGSGGGYPILQVGTLDASDGGSGASPYKQNYWWEAIGNTDSWDTGIQRLLPTDLRPGDNVHLYAAYNPSTGAVLFIVENETTGLDWSHFYTTVNGHNISDAWNGAAANMIDERITVTKNGTESIIHGITNLESLSLVGVV